MTDTALPEADDHFIRAGQYVLGVLEEDELSTAQRDLLADSAFGHAVEWWEWRLAAMAEQAGEFTPSQSVWRAIEARLDAEQEARSSAVPVTPNRISNWNLAALLTGTGMMAASLLLFFATPRQVEVMPTEIATAASDQLIVQLQDEETGRRLASLIDVSNRRLALTIAGLKTDMGKTPELWVIPEGGAPVSLGAIPQTGQFQRDLSVEESALLIPGASIAVTFENETGRRHLTPTMPIILIGSLDQIELKT